MYRVHYCRRNAAEATDGSHYGAGVEGLLTLSKPSEAVMVAMVVLLLTCTITTTTPVPAEGAAPVG